MNKSLVETDIDLNTFQKNVEVKKSSFISSSSSPLIEIPESMGDFENMDGLKKSDAQQDADCADGNKDVRIESILLIPCQQAQLNQAVESPRETALIRLYDTYKRYNSSPIDCIPWCSQIVCLGSDLNQNSNLHWMSQHRASWTESETALSELNARGVW